MLVDVWLRENYVNCMPESHFVLQLSVGLSALLLTDIDIVVFVSDVQRGFQVIESVCFRNTRRFWKNKPGK